MELAKQNRSRRFKRHLVPKDSYIWFTDLVCFDALHPSQHFFSHIGMGLPQDFLA